MRVGFAPLWSAWIEHSNDIRFVVGWILTMDYVCTFGRVRSMGPKIKKNILGHPLKTLFMLIIMAQFPASYFIHIPRYNVSIIWHWIHGVYKCSAMYSARYLGLGVRYGAGICTIVISMNGAFKWCPFCFRLNFDPKSWKAMDYSLWSSALFGKNMTKIKINF